LRRIPIELAPNVSKEQAEKDFKRERVLLNGVYFIPDKVDMVRCEAFALSLRHLVERLQRQENESSSSSSSKASSISDIILQRGCRTSAGADSFFMVQKLLCVEGTFKDIYDVYVLHIYAYMFMCIFMYIYIHVYLHTYIYISTYLQIYIHIYT
jgi:hypothetical protein